MDGHYNAGEAAAIALETMKAERESRADDYPDYRLIPGLRRSVRMRPCQKTRNSPRTMGSCSVTWSMVNGLNSVQLSMPFNVSLNESAKLRSPAANSVPGMNWLGHSSQWPQATAAARRSLTDRCVGGLCLDRPARQADPRPPLRWQTVDRGLSPFRPSLIPLSA